ncbi:MAG TPA: NAD(P)-dependent alcohol dehydrogenase [Devosia sp.]|jgi:NADPH:quinone reductase-like Zn-dependent oxidoreductase|nr:NAD(P)-dependent alcohol dehydrogenase [Devosia sp.]
MRALVYDKYGPPDTLRLEQLPVPEPKAGEVRVRVHAASVNSWDWDKLTGAPQGALRALMRPQHRILGADIAGVVDAVGAGVDRLKSGDAVFGDLCMGAWGGFADYVCARADALAIKPEAIDFTAAAALPQAGLLALQGLRLYGEPTAGERLLINGAGGGVGTFAIQIAKQGGAHVTAVDRGDKAEALSKLGADKFIDYQAQDFTRTGERYDLILDMIGRKSVADYRRALASGGRLVLVGGTFGTVISVVSVGKLAARAAGQRMGLLLYRPSLGELEEIAARCAAGSLVPVIDNTYPLEQGASALRRLGDGDHTGKIIIEMA